MTCSHGMPSPASCIDCMDEGPVAPPATWTRVGPSFSAQYGGNCRSCGSDYLIGDSIRRWDRRSEATRYTHAECGAPPT